MKTPECSLASARLRVAWLAGAALLLSACNGPGLEPPGTTYDSDSIPAQHAKHGGTRPPTAAGSGGRETGGSATRATGGKTGTGGSGGGVTDHTPMTSRDAGAPENGEDGGTDPASA